MMADSTKYIPINERSIVSDLKLKNIFSFRTKKTKAFVFIFISVFVAVTFFLAFNPSPDPSSPWFSNIFIIDTTPNSTTADRSHISNIYSYFFPSNSQNSTVSSLPGSLGIPTVIKDHPIVQNQTDLVTELTSKSRESVQVIRGNDVANMSSHRIEEQNRVNNVSSLPKKQGSDGLKQGNDGKKQEDDVKKQGNDGKKQGDDVKKQGDDVKKQRNDGKKQGDDVKKQGNDGKKQGDDVKKQGNNGNKQGNDGLKQGNEGMKQGNDGNKQGIDVKKQGNDGLKQGNKGMKQGNDGLKQGNEGMKQGNDGNKQGIDVKKQGNDGLKQGNEGMKQGNEGLKHGNNGTKQVIEDLVKNLVNCNLFDGEWVRDESYPLYKPGSCSLIDEQFNCFSNGRLDLGFQQYKWKPKDCTLPRLDGRKMLQLLRGKRLVFVGDSLNRNMWESLVCILRNLIKDKTKVYEASGRHHFRSEASYAFVFKDYNCTVEMFVAPFLVQEWETKDKNGTKKETLRLDLISSSAPQYKTADVIVFNTGHWWTHDKTARGEDYYQEGSHVYHELNVLEAFRKAMTTWGMWVDANINPTKTSVFFRGYSASHFSGGQWNSGGACDHESEPINNTSYLTPYPDKMTVLEKVFKGMKTQVAYLNITRLTDFRKDGHPSIYRKQHYTPAEINSPLHYQDCSHWCLPGVPDAWNEILYAQLLVKQYQSKQKL